MKIRQLGSGKYSDCFKVSGGGRAVCLKLSYYRESTMRRYAMHAHQGNMGAAHAAVELDAVAVATAMAEVGRVMRCHRVSPHIVDVHREADVRDLPRRLAPLLARRLPSLTARQLACAHVCVMELCACTMTSLVTRSAAALTDAALRALVFQVVYTLACLQRALPGFRHNDLSTNNVLVKRQPPGRGAAYRFAGRTFYLRAEPLHAVLADFDFTHVPRHAVLSNERVISGRYSISARPDPSYDAHVFLKSLQRCLGRATHLSETREFLHALRLSEHARPRGAVPHLEPARLLQHAYFRPLRRARPVDVTWRMPD